MPSTLSVLFISPSVGTPQVFEEDQLKSYLAIGTLASTLRDGPFLQNLAQQMAAAAPAVAVDPPAVRVELLHFEGKPAIQTVSDFLAERAAALNLRPDIIAMTATSVHLELAEELAAAAARHFPHALRVVGGPHASVRPEDFLRHSDFHAACIGEGVETMAELALRWTLAKEKNFTPIAGIAFKDARENVHRNPPRRPLFHLDDYPFPSDSLDLFWPHLDDPEQNARFPVSVLAGFGCPHDCIFCAQRCIHAGKVRERSAESIFAEVERLYTRGFRKFAFVQETFLNSRRRVRRFCELVGKSGLGIEWTVEARADQVNREGLMRMRSAGLKFLQLGVESGDEELLRAIGKDIRRDHIVRVTEWCRELRIHSAFYMLVGLPGQGWQSILRSALLVWEHTPYNLLTRHVSVAITIPYPGTRIARDGTVRVIDWTRRNWPERNPAVELGDDGEFLGRAFTETDDMTADEIFEAWLYLDDFCHFLMHARYGEGDAEDHSKSMDYARRLLNMILRRTVRDLVIRSQPDFTPQMRTAALHDLSQRDGHAERHFKDVAAATEPLFASLLHFLSVARFENGFDIMRRLEIPSRLKWIKICALAWLCSGKACGQIAFTANWEETGEILGHRLRGIWAEAIDRCLAEVESGEAPEVWVQPPPDGGFQVFGIIFRADARTGRLSVPAQSA
jgi:anaerobic magnesium-protoporphyrin IX monomethyl ester cyclase